jgi:DNA repair protein RadC
MRGLRIQELPDQQKPREKLLRRGVHALTDAEVLAILLRTGVQGCNVIELAERLLLKYGSLAHLSRCSIAELAGLKGIGPAKALQLAAAFGLSARLVAEQAASGPLDKPEAIYQMLGTEMRILDRESLRSVLVDARCRLIAVTEISRGTLNESLAHPREIFKPAISHSAFGFMLVHNHPSGDPAPSESDIRLTRRVSESAQILQIRFLDHIIVGSPHQNRPGYFSFKEAGILG